MTSDDWWGASAPAVGPQRSRRPASRRRLKPVFDRVVLQALGPLSLAMGIVFTMFVAIGMAAGRPVPGQLAVIVTDALSGLLYFGLYVCLHRNLIAHRWASPVGFAGGIVTTLNALLAYALLDDRFFLAYLPLVLIGYGSFMLSLRWLAASLLSVTLCSVVATWGDLSTADVILFGPVWVGSSLLSAVLVTVRRWGVQAADDALRAARAETLQRKRVERKLAQSQRLESVGKLVSGVAHDFNNLLMPVIGYADMTLLRMSETDPLRQNLTEIRRAAESAAALTRKLLAFSRQQVLQPEVLDINEIVRDAQPLLEQSIDAGIELVIELDPAAGLVSVDPVQMAQVLLNLTINSRDAMPDGGRLVIATHAASDTTPLATPGVALEVSDTGLGMSAQVRERMFEPFFTTKQPERGTGLGLASVYGIVKQSGGWIDVDSAPGAGTRVRILLPRVESPAPRPRDVQAAARTSSGGTETVLLTEDDDQVRKVVAATLRNGGYRVLEAADADQALEMASQQAFDVLVSDVVMPGMSGPELAGELRARGTTPAVVFMSGYAPGEGPGGGESPLDGHFVAKPFRGDDLLEALRRALDQS